MQFEFTKKEALAKAEQEKKDAFAAEEKKRQRFILLVVIAGLLIMVVFALFIYRSYKQKKNANVIITEQKEEVERQKELIEKKNKLVEEKQKEILDSIRYARRIQNSLLPTAKYIEKHLHKLKKN
jgi:flagellar basal body-associated protein FliL